MTQAGKSLHVEVDARVASSHDLDGDFSFVGEHDGPVGQRVWSNRGQNPAAYRRVYQRSTCRQGIGRLAGRGGNDQAVRTLVRDKSAIDFDP